MTQERKQEIEQRITAMSVELAELTAELVTDHITRGKYQSAIEADKQRKVLQERLAYFGTCVREDEFKVKPVMRGQ